jgi:hypothetical protein
MIRGTLVLHRHEWMFKLQPYMYWAKPELLHVCIVYIGYLIQFQFDEHWMISTRSTGHPPTTGGGSLTTTTTPPLITTTTMISTSSRARRQSIRPSRWWATRWICGLGSSSIATSVRPVCSSTRVELVLCWWWVVSVWMTSGGSSSVAMVTVWGVRGGAGGGWRRCGGDVAVVVCGLEVSPSVHVPDDCHLFEGVLHYRLWVVLGTLQLISVTILWDW